MSPSTTAEGFWALRFAELKKFKAEYGHCDVPQKFKDNKQLGNWVSSQRLYYKNFMEDNGKKTAGMNRKRIEMLEKIGFCWTINLWKVRFDELLDFKAEHGHCNVPRKCKEYPRLGNWVSLQRQHYKNFMEDNGKKTAGMNQERINTLEEIEFCWFPVDNIWEHYFAELQSYKAQHGHCNVPQRFKDSPQLGSWVCRQRMGYKNFMEGIGKYSNGINHERIKRLEEVGFIWSPANARSDDSWMVQFEMLKDYKAKRGHCNVLRFKDDPKLWNWVREQRLNYKNFMEDNGRRTSSINQAQIDMLEEIGFCWSSVNVSPNCRPDDDWMVQFARLKNYKGKQGHCNVPRTSKANLKLAKWVSNHRQYYKNFMENNGKKIGGINEGKIRMLEKIGFCWFVGHVSALESEKAKRSIDWMAQFERLKNYKAEHGHCNVPRKFPKLGDWVYEQRYCYNNLMENNGKRTGYINQERINLLEGIGFGWSSGTNLKKRALGEVEFEEVVESLDLSDLVASGSNEFGGQPTKRLKAE